MDKIIALSANEQDEIRTYAVRWERKRRNISKQPKLKEELDRVKETGKDEYEKDIGTQD